MKILNQWRRFATKKMVLIATAIWILFHVFWIITGDFFQLSIPSENILIMDLKLFYDLSYVQNYFLAIGADNLEAFINFHLYYDSVYPLIYGFLLLVLITNLSKGRKLYALLFPIAAIIFDFYENYYLIQMASDFTYITAETTSLSSVMSNLKWVSIIGSIAMILYYKFSSPTEN